MELGTDISQSGGYMEPAFEVEWIAIESSE